MKIPIDLFEKAHLPDIVLFASGACHAFATELQLTLPDENYSLIRISAKPDRADGYHIVCLDPSGTFVVDVGGIRRLDDVMTWCRAFLRCEPLATPVTAETLTTSVKVGDKGLALNAFNHHVDPAFLAYCRLRASILVNDFPGRYKASLMRTNPDNPNRSH